jgi:hypothetical protein
MKERENRARKSNIIKTLKATYGHLFVELNLQLLHENHLLYHVISLNPSFIRGEIN